MQARELVDAMREEELEFLGMKWFKDAAVVEAENMRKENREQRKVTQLQYEKDLQDMKEKIDKELKDSDSKDLET